MNTTENKFYDDWSENLYGERGIADVNIKHSKKEISIIISY